MLNEQELSQKFNDMSHEELVRYAVQLQMANQNFKEQLQLIRARKFGHTSEKLAELQLNLFNCRASALVNKNWTQILNITSV